MKVSEAESLICPFMQRRGSVEMGYNHSTDTIVERFTRDARPANINCITTKCMAWKVTKTKSDYEREQYVRDDGLGRKSMQTRQANLEPQGCEGYCQRLKG